MQSPHLNGEGLPLKELLGYQKKTLYYSACIAICFVIERFWETNFFGLSTRQQERPRTRRSTTL